MGKRDLIRLLSQFKKALENQNIHVEKMILYGSWAKKSQREDSDIDVVVISKDFENKKYWERIDLLSNAIYDIFAPIEAVALTPKEWNKKESFVCEYARNGEVIFS